MALPSQICLVGLAPEGKHSPPAALKAGKLSPISRTDQKKGKKAKAGKQQHGKGSSLAPPALGQGSPPKSPASTGPCSWGDGVRWDQTSAKNFLQINESNP